MRIPLQFGILGLGLGGTYALSALGLVIVYRGSRTINLASGAIGMVGAYIFWELHDQHGMNFFAAAIPALAACAVIGAVSYLLFLRPLRNATPLAHILVTIGLLTSIVAIVGLRFPASEEVVNSSLPITGVRVLGVTIGESQLWLFLIAILLALGLGAVYKWTRFGLATTVNAESRLAASTLGYSPDWLAAGNWALGSALSGLAAILLAPLIGLSSSVFTSLLIPALAAAVVGRMSSFPVTVLAGMVIGVAESEMAHYITAPGWPAALPFIIVFAVLAVRGRTLPRRGELTSTRLASVGSGRVRPLALMAVIALALVWIYTVSGSWVATTVTEITIGIVILSVVVVTGYAGQLSLCQFALAGVGAYVAGRLFAAVGLPFGVALLLAVVAAVPVGVVVGLPAVRSRGTDLAVATLCLDVAVESVLFDSAKLTGGDLGTDVSSASLFGIKMDTVTDTRGFAVVCLVFAVLAGLVVANLRRSRTGRQLLAIRSNERAAAALGISVVGVKLRAFTIGSAIAALGGALFAFENSPIVYTSFTWLNFLPTSRAFGVIGGVGYGAGPYFGSSLAPGSLGSSIGNLFGYNIQTYLLLASGFILILMVIQSPDGVAARTSRDIVKLGRMLARWAHAIVGEGRTLPRILRPGRGAPATNGAAGLSSAVPRREEASLSVRGVSVSFGGTRALDDVGLDVTAGEVMGIIGPNGAGKTTLIEVITGFVRPRSGSVSVGEVGLSSLRPEKRARSGVALTFQSLELFEDMTVLENLVIAAEESTDRPWWALAKDLCAPGRVAIPDAVRAVTDGFGLREYLDRRIDQLPYGTRRLVAVARGIVGGPAVLLLDEPAAGLNRSECEQLGTALRAVAKTGVAVGLIEHDMEFVMGYCDRITVLDFGRVIAAGSPEQVRNDPQVVQAYLGAPVPASAV